MTDTAAPVPTGQGHWDEDPDYPVDDWKYQIANDDTRLGYAEWVASEREANK